MGINRTKVLDKAQKYVQQGKLAKAVEEYNLLVEDDPSDVRTLLKVGDLYARMGNIEGGLATYKRVADHYSKDGFFLKAVAVYKQMLKLDPSSIPIYTQLAQLYNQLGLNSEAMKQYQIVAKHYETKGMKKESLDIYKKISELDPENVASRVKLAELYAREGHEKQALEDYLRIAEDLRSKGNNEDLIKIYEKIVKIDAGRVDIVRALAGLYLETGEPKRALAKLQICFKQDPKQEQTLSLLARAFIDLQQPEKARAVYTELMNLYEEKGARDKAQGIRAKLTADGNLESGVSDVSIPSVAPAPAAPPVTAKPAAAAGDKGKGGGESDVDKVMTDVEVYQRYGLTDKATLALQQLLKRHPELPQVRQKLAEIYLGNNDVKGAAQALMQVAAVAHEAKQDNIEMSILGEVISVDPENMEAMQRLQELQSSSFASMQEDFNRSKGGADAASSSMLSNDMPEVVESSIDDDMEVVELSDHVEEPAEEQVADDAQAAMEPTAYVIEEDAVADAGSLPLMDDAPEPISVGKLEMEMLRPEDSSTRSMDAEAEASQILYDPNDAKPLELDAEPDASPMEVAMEATAYEPIAASKSVVEAAVEVEHAPLEIEIEGYAAEPEPELAPEPIAPPPVPVVKAPAPKPVVAPPVAKAKVAADPFKHEIEEVRFFIEQGLNDEAAAVLHDVLRKSPEHATALALAEQHGLHLKSAPAVKPPSPKPAAKTLPKATPPPVPKAAEPKIELEAAAEPAAEMSISSHIEMERPSAELEEGGDFFDLAGELKEEIDHINKADTKKGEDEPLTFDEVFAAFKKGVQQTVSEDETEAHYNLGIAYKEMGLLDDAIMEFRICLKDVRLSVDGCVLIGICYREMQRYNEAEASFKKALESLAPADERCLGVRYELAEVYAQAGKLKEALGTFKEVYNSSQAFRDVSHRMKELAEQIEGNVDDDKSDAKKKSKISFL